MHDPMCQLLFPGEGETTYAILDGASCGELLARLDAWQPDHVCLFPGAPAPDVEAAAPFLVELRPGHAFTEWLLAEGWGKHWGIFARSAANLRAMRKHFRSLFVVRSPAATLLYFRFYDPRVLTRFLPTTSAREREDLFGRVTVFLCETAAGDVAIFRRRGPLLDQQTVPGTSAGNGREVC